MNNIKVKIINKLGGKQVNIYLNDETLILEEMYEKKFNQKPNRSKIYKEYLKKQLSDELILEAKTLDKNICSCCENDYSLTKQQMYICKANNKTCIICQECLIK
ncbi:hypothetical protein CK556_00325 [Mesoplasma chauliocola]|uniref:Uncharacterized protein n=1 Tax=Mesoplasma chauliocola TaxID=216427 RepID=A0A249SMH2_9MOLU|nr:hypothetical protein [Mesoplasma chauliocola]ASZ08813.1 hypothetical protein CK556_00325 [Mesoplasma chauliocola]